MKNVLSTVSLLFVLISCAQVAQKKDYKHSVDAHMHIHKSDEKEDMEFHASRALFAADSVGIQRAIVLSNAYSKMAYKDYARTQNHYLANEVKKNKEKLSGACAVNPLMDWAFAEMTKCRSEGLEVLTIHPMSSGMDLRSAEDQKELKKILAHADKLNFTLLIHGHLPRLGEAEDLLKVLEGFPDLKIIIGHSLGREFIHLKKFHHPDFLVEVSVAPIWTKSAAEKDSLVSVMRKVGVEKFIFGSDWPVIHPAETVKALSELPLTPEELEKIVYTNAAALDYLFK